MRYLLALIALGAAVSACSTLPLPGVTVGSGVPRSCGERLSEPTCREGTRCRWVNDARRADGTIATAHCEGE